MLRHAGCLGTLDAGRFDASARGPTPMQALFWPKPICRIVLWISFVCCEWVAVLCQVSANRFCVSQETGAGSEPENGMNN